MPVQWRCTVDGEEFDIPVDKAVFSYDVCKFTATGSDGEGCFEAIGVIEKHGDTVIKQVYESKRWRRFEGRFEENVLSGKWKSEDKQGTFTLEVISTVWHDESNFVALKSLNEFVGIGLSLIHICRCRRLLTCRSRWSPYH
eukprot:TRINITY_DN22588_c0_g2_i2.p2 TRINITY_DN22588_c0_g2~~TRINITY_DN22588_c0_g2_i2.p2  ORF type:complete len:141 (+),score=39.34 TRINITY_DN22588_c0_g2_i2:204-626(+)